MPKFIKYDYIHGSIIDGSLEAISFYTDGITTAESTLKLLSDKFGKPTTIEKFVVKNKLGTSFDTFNAIWTHSNYMIEFNPTYESLDHGTARIETLKSFKY